MFPLTECFGNILTKNINALIQDKTFDVFESVYYYRGIASLKFNIRPYLFSTSEL